MPFLASNGFVAQGHLMKQRTEAKGIKSFVAIDFGILFFGTKLCL